MPTRDTQATLDRRRFASLAVGWDNLAARHRRARDLAGDHERRYHHDRQVGRCLDRAAHYRAQVAALSAAGGAS